MDTQMNTRAAGPGRVPMSVVDRKKVEYDRSLGSARKSFQVPTARASQFGLEYLVLLACLTASLLFLPLILPPLPPPPFLLLLLPIGILTVLMFLAFMPSNVRDIAL